MDSQDDLITNLLKPKLQEPAAEVDRLAHPVIGAAIEVHRQLGPGLLEAFCSDDLVLKDDKALAWPTDQC